MRFPKLTAAFALASVVLGGCGFADDAETTSTHVGSGEESGPSSFVKGSGSGKKDASVEAVFLDFSFDASVVTDSPRNEKKRIEDQLLYTVGQLNGDNSVGRVDRLELSDIRTTETDEGGTKISYSAEMLVAWGERDDVPNEYTFSLPKDLSRDGRRAFVDAYVEECVSYSAHDVDANSMWYYYRPARRGCELADEDVERATATVAPSEVQTSGKYPEYHRIWEDDLLKVTAVFGKYEAGATTDDDAGIEGYNEFIDRMEESFEGAELSTSPEEIPSNPGVDVPSVTFEASFEDGRNVEVHTFLVDGVRSARESFDERYAELTRDSDLIAYNGHSGLGSNIRAMARKGDWRQGQYSVIFMNGCDTYAYVDSALADAHARVNPDDDTGTKYMDLVMNAMPSYFSNMPYATEALIDGLMRRDDPVTYEKMLADISESQVALVSGEQDNEFVPGMNDDDDGDGADPVENWEGMEESATVAEDEQVRFETPRLSAGRYRFDLSGTGDADLYVRAGEQPDLETYDCRPYRTGSDESCVVDIGSPAPIHVMLVGYRGESEVELRGAPASEE